MQKVFCRYSGHFVFHQHITTCRNCEGLRSSSSKLILCINSCNFVIFVNQRVPFSLRLKTTKKHRRFVKRALSLARRWALYSRPRAQLSTYSTRFITTVSTHSQLSMISKSERGVEHEHRIRFYNLGPTGVRWLCLHQWTCICICLKCKLMLHR